MKSFSLVTLVLAAALAGCDAGIAGSAGTPGSGPACADGPAACPTMGKGAGGGSCPSAAASQAVAPAAEQTCPIGVCDESGECGPKPCEKKGQCDQMKQCEDMPKCDGTQKCDDAAKKACSPKTDPKVGN